MSPKDRDAATHNGDNEPTSNRAVKLTSIVCETVRSCRDTECLPHTSCATKKEDYIATLHCHSETDNIPRTFPTDDVLTENASNRSVVRSHSTIFVD